MLKWLVTKSPSNASADNSVTDDPFATFTRGNKKNKSEPIYAVSRVNPIFEEESKSTVEEIEAKKYVRNERNSPDSPPTDRESVRSSGYGSKETDSVSYKSEVQEDEGLNEVTKTGEELNGGPNNFELNSPGCVADIRRSFEVLTNPELRLTKHDCDDDKVIIANPEYVKNIEVIPSPLQNIPEATNELEHEQVVQKKSSWPRVSHLAQALQRQAERIQQRKEREKFKEKLRNKNVHNYKHQVLRFNPLVSVVAQDERYVTEISLSPNEKTKTQKRIKHYSNENYINDVNFQLGYSSASHVTAGGLPANRVNKIGDQVLQPDSLINEDTLRMMNSPEFEANLAFDERNLSVNENLPQETLPNFGKAIYSNFHPTLNRGTSSHYTLGKRERNSKSLNRAKLNGVSVIKDLWDKSGLKTNGRKLLVNSNSLVPDNISITPYNGLQGSLDDIDSRKTIYLKENGGNNDIEEMYENQSSLIRPSSSCNFACHSYEYFTNSAKGIDNLGYMKDIGTSADSLASSHSKHSYPFQHSLTEFQKMVSDKLQDESSEKSLKMGRRTNNNDKNQIKKENSYKKKHHPGRAVRELSLEPNPRHSQIKGLEENISASPSGRSHLNEGNQGTNSNGQRNRMLTWEQFGNRFKEDTFPSYFFRHPNSEAPIFAHQDGFRDFTLDAKRSHRIMRRSSRAKRRRKCCVGFLVLFAFIAFVGIIIGLSWFSTGGNRLFGPM